MPLDTKYDDHGKMLVRIETAQSGERERRKACKESKLFLSEKDGQWEQRAIEKMDGRYRGTFDMLSPIVESFEGEVVKASFTIRVSPSNGVATKETAKLYDGMIRNIRNISDAEHIFEKVAVSNYICGFDCFEIVQEFVPGSFDQDLLFKEIANAMDSVWFDPLSIKQDRSDANWAIKLVTIPLADYKSRWPDGGQISIGDNAEERRRINKNTHDTVTIGQLYYKKEKEVELVQMSDGAVYEVDEKFKSIVDDMANPQDGSQPITETRRRKDKLIKVHSRMLDGSDWLNKEQETVFELIPLCPIYGNYDIVDRSYVYFGKILKLIDPQRIYNYAQSRDIEDGALGMSEKIVMTDKQVSDNDYSRLHTGNDPIIVYDVDRDATPPYKLPAAQANPALQTTMANVQQMVNTTSNSFQAQQGNAAATQSGVAGLQQIEQANIGSIKWMKPLSVTLCYAAKVLLPAIPLTYDGERQVRILEEDGTSNIVPLNKPTFDQETQTNVTLNDLSKGKYDAVCDMGPAFNSSQKEAARSLEATLVTNPELGPMIYDVLFKVKKEPGMDIVAERLREQAFNNGVIPESQWTDEEKQQAAEAQAAAANQPPQEDPNMVLARAEEGKAQAEQLNAQTKQQEAQFTQRVKIADNQLDNRKLDIREKEIQLEANKFQLGQDDKFNKDAADIEQGQQKIDLETEKLSVNTQQANEKIDLQAQQQEFNQLIEMARTEVDNLKKQTEALKTIREASGVDVIMGPGVVQAFANQSREVIDAQQTEGKLEPTLPVIDNQE